MEKRDRAAAAAEGFSWFFLLGAVFWYLWSYLPNWFLWGFLAVPLALTLCFAVARRVFRQKKRLLRILGALLAVFTFLISAYSFTGAASAAENLWSTDDPANYQRKRSGTLDYPLGKMETFFPESIPETAKDVKFHYNPQILQGGGEFRLEFTVTPEEAEQWAKLLDEKSRYPGSYADRGLSPGRPADFGCSDYPYGARVYVVAARDYQHWNPEYWTIDFWNHGALCGGVVSVESGRVCLYESQW